MTSPGSQSTLMVRAARRDDVEAIVALENAAFQPPWSRALVERALSDAKSSVLVAQNAEEIVAYASGWSLGNEAELDRVAVSPEYRGQGIAARLLQSFIEECRARKAGEIFLEVRVDNTAARRLYQRAGFLVVGRRPRYYHDGEDALILHLKL